jgi:HK97 family phage portal protein
LQIKLPFLGKISLNIRRNQEQYSPEFERFRALLYGYSDAKMPITAETAIKTAAVIRCVDVVATDMATMPLELFRRTAGGTEKAKDHRLYPLLHNLANPETTAFDFWRMFFYNSMLTRAAYANVERDRNGFIVALRNLPSRYCRMKRNEQTGERYVEYNNGKIKTAIYPENLLYMPGARLSDVDNPLDPIELASRVLHLSSALNQFAANYFDNGANSGGIVSLDTPAKEIEFRQFKKDFDEAYAGLQNSSKLMFLNGGIKFTPSGANPNESQALESRQNQVLEICRMMGVSPLKAFDYGRATWDNAEQVNIEYVQSTLNPRAVQLEQTIYRDLLMPFERSNMFAKFNFYSLLRGDTTAQTSHFHLMRQDGVYNANDIRDLMDKNRIPADEGGDAYLVNGNMISLKTAMNQQPKNTGTAPAK